MNQRILQWLRLLFELLVGVSPRTTLRTYLKYVRAQFFETLIEYHAAEGQRKFAMSQVVTLQAREVLRVKKLAQSL